MEQSVRNAAHCRGIQIARETGSPSIGLPMSYSMPRATARDARTTAKHQRCEIRSQNISEALLQLAGMSDVDALQFCRLLELLQISLCKLCVFIFHTVKVLVLRCQVEAQDCACNTRYHHQSNDDA